MVCRELGMSAVSPALQCAMTLVIASIGSEGLLGTETLQSCLPHQLDLRTGQLWADGQSTLPLHQQRQAVRASVLAKGSVVIPPDSNIVAPVSIRSPASIPPGRCSLIELDTMITENYGELIGRTLVDTSNWSAEVFLINPGSNVVVLPPFCWIVIIDQVFGRMSVPIWPAVWYAWRASPRVLAGLLWDTFWLVTGGTE